MNMNLGNKANMSDSGRKERKISGIILASEWDEKGRPVGFKLYATDETEYHLNYDKKFLDFLKKSVVVTAADFSELNGVVSIENPISIELG